MQISDHARTCPHCGAPVIATIKRRQKAALIDLGIRLLLAVVIGVTIWLALGQIFKQALVPIKAIGQKNR